jgi:[ribosomal protein S5]-alanine N-acetyltransferase
MSDWMLETPRLQLRHLNLDDAADIARLLQTPGFLQFIGDRGVRNEVDAIRYLTDGPIASYAKNGFGLNAIIHKRDQVLIGMCGILKRENLPEPDLGYALFPEYFGLGYAAEAAGACVAFARELGIPALLAIVQGDNASSIRLLTSLGFEAAGTHEAILKFRLML